MISEMPLDPAFSARLCLKLAAMALFFSIGPAVSRTEPDAVAEQPADATTAPEDAETPSRAQQPETSDRAEEATLSGRIVLEDESPATAKGWLYSHWTSNSGNRSAFRTEGQYTDRFSITVPAGTVWLKYFAEGFAPSWVGPLEIDPGEDRKDVALILKPGFSVPIRVIDEPGSPVSGATLVAHPLIGGSTNGPNFEKTTDKQGEHVLEHVANAQYKFRVTAPGYEPLRTEPMTVAPIEPLVLTMTPSLPTTGVVLDADGSPAAGAKMRFRYEAVVDGSDLGAGYGHGSVVATADERGRFTLDQLTRTSRYLFIVETADNARMVVRDLRAGQQDVRLQVPKRRDLRVRIVGDLDKLPERSGKPYISVRQEISIDEENLNHTDLIGEDAYVTPSAEGGVAEYQGLVAGTVRVTAGDQKQTVDVVEDGVTEVVFQFPEGQ